MFITQVWLRDNWLMRPSFNTSTNHRPYRDYGAVPPFNTPAQYNVLKFIRQHVCLRDASDRPSCQQKEDNSYESGADTGKIQSEYKLV